MCNGAECGHGLADLLTQFLNFSKAACSKFWRSWTTIICAKTDKLEAPGVDASSSLPRLYLARLISASLRTTVIDLTSIHVVCWSKMRFPRRTTRVARVLRDLRSPASDTLHFPRTCHNNDPWKWLCQRVDRSFSPPLEWLDLATRLAM